MPLVYQLAELCGTSATSTRSRENQTRARDSGSPCTSKMPHKSRCSVAKSVANDSEDNEECRAHKIFRDLLCKYYPRYGVPLHKELNCEFIASKAEDRFVVFPDPGVRGFIVC